MKLVVFSDVHANLPALERFVALTKRVADRYVCLGDVVNYGPWNDECLLLIGELPGIILLEGNHEQLFLGKHQIDEEIPLVKRFFSLSFPLFTRRDLIDDLPISVTMSDYVFTHTIADEKVYADSTIEPTSNYFIGHTHHAFCISRNGHQIINCGSIGQNRASIEQLNYAIFDTETRQVELCAAEYRFDVFLAELASRGYPAECMSYYQNKRRRTNA